VGEGVGEGVGDGVGEGVGDGVLPPLGLFFAAFFGRAGEGSEPDGENDATCGGADTLAGVTADGAAEVFLLEVALPIPNAAPNATSAATAPTITAREPVIRGRSPASSASRSPGRCI
jgi:hypothetical protein